MFSHAFEPNDVLVNVVQGPTATIAVAFMEGFSATGEAKCCPTDEHNPEVGATLATARALVALGEAMEEYAIKRSHILCRN